MLTAFARNAALLTTYYGSLDVSARTIERLRDTMASRWPIEQAKGVIM